MLISQLWRFIGQDNMKKIFKIVFVIAILALYGNAHAGDISIVRALPKGSSINVGDEALFQINILSQNKNYNAIEGELYVSDNLEIKNVITGNSIITIWLENPTSYEGNIVKFSGIVPAGYIGAEGQVFSIVARAKDKGSAAVSLKHLNLFLNDGQGTSESVTEKDISVSILPADPKNSPYLITFDDKNPPEDFKATLVKDPNLYGGKYTIVWNAQDKGSGIESYDVLEGRKVFKQSMSPYILENQRLSAKIYVRAYDNAGNEVVTNVDLPGRFCTGVRCFGPADLFFFIVILSALYIFLWHRKKRNI